MWVVPKSSAPFGNPLVENPQVAGASREEPHASRFLFDSTGRVICNGALRWTLLADSEDLTMCVSITTTRERTT